MARIIPVPESVGEPPMYDWRQPRSVYDQAEDAWVARLAEWCRTETKGAELSGEVIAFPVADGYARYMVVRVVPTVTLIHLPLGDAWTFRYAKRLIAKDVRDEVARSKSLAALWGGKA